MDQPASWVSISRSWVLPLKRIEAVQHMDSMVITRRTLEDAIKRRLRMKRRLSGGVKLWKLGSGRSPRARLLSIDDADTDAADPWTRPHTSSRATHTPPSFRCTGIRQSKDLFSIHPVVCCPKPACGQMPSITDSSPRRFGHGERFQPPSSHLLNHTKQ